MQLHITVYGVVTVIDVCKMSFDAFQLFIEWITAIR
jgi:hypothetical protein